MGILSGIVHVDSHGWKKELEEKIHRGGSMRRTDPTLLALKMEEGARRQVKLVAWRSWRRQETGFSPRTSTRDAAR